MNKLYNLIEIRKDYHLTQRQIARYLNISKSTYSEVENNPHKLKLEYLYKLSYLFNVSPEYISELIRNRKPLEPKLKKAIQKKYQLKENIEGNQKKDTNQVPVA